MPVHNVRIAQAADLAAIMAIQNACFAPETHDREWTTPDELIAAVEDELVYVAETAESGDASVVGYLRFDRPGEDHLYLAAVAVVAEHRDNGAARELLSHLLTENSALEQDRVLVTTVVSPDNLAMLSALCQVGFVGRTIFRDYAGPGRDRIYCQLKSRTEYINRDGRYLLRADASERIDDLLADEAYMVTRVHRDARGSLLELSSFDREDISTLQAEESNSSVQFSGALLAGLTFLLGAAFEGKLADPVRIILVQATALTLVATVIYTNASGDLARIHSDTFESHMKWANLLSEYGGVVPIFFVLPATFTLTQQKSNVFTSAAVGFAVMIVAAGYEFSQYAVMRRYRSTLITKSLLWLTVPLPLVGVFAVQKNLTGWIWALVATLVIYARILVFASPDIHEEGQQPGRSGWRIR